MESKIPFYNIINMFLIGIVFLIAFFLVFYNFTVDLINQYPIFINFCLDFKLITYIIIIGVIYEIGLIINRISSIVIESLFIKFKFINIGNYSKFNDYKKGNSFLYTLSREYASARSSFTLWLILFIMFLINGYWGMSIVSFIISVIFCFSFLKMSWKIEDIITK